MLFESVNTHSGDNQIVELSIEKTNEKTIRDLMLQLFILDNNETYNLKQNESDNSVVYSSTITGKTIKFYLYLKKGEEYILSKPSSEGVFYLRKKLDIARIIEFRIELICDEKFSNKFGENKSILFGLVFSGDDDNENKTFS